jgi:hypothetical protein
MLGFRCASADDGFGCSWLAGLGAVPALFAAAPAVFEGGFAAAFLLVGAAAAAAVVVVPDGGGGGRRIALR